jgi:hypothetical protein
MGCVCCVCVVCVSILVKTVKIVFEKPFLIPRSFNATSVDLEKTYRVSYNLGPASKKNKFLPSAPPLART